MAFLDAVTCDIRTVAEFNASAVGAGPGGSITFASVARWAGRSYIILANGDADTTADLSLSLGNPSTFTLRFLAKFDEWITDSGVQLTVCRLLGGIGGLDFDVAFRKDASNDIKFIVGSGLQASIATLTFTLAEYIDLAGSWFLIQLSLDDAADANKWKFDVTVLRASRLFSKTANGINTNVDGPWATARFISQALIGGSGADRKLKLQQIILDGAYGADLGSHLFLQTEVGTSNAPRDGSETAWEQNPNVGADSYQNVDEIPHDADGTYLFRDDTGQNSVDRFHFPDVDAPLLGGPTDQVPGFLVGVVGKNAGAVPTGQITALLANATHGLIGSTSAITPGVSYTTHRKAGASSQAVTKATIDDARLSARADVDEAGEAVRLTLIWVALLVDGSSVRSDSGTGTDTATSLVVDVAAEEQRSGSDVGLLSVGVDSTPDSGTGSDAAVGIGILVTDSGTAADASVALDVALSSSEQPVPVESTVLVAAISVSDEALGVETSVVEQTVTDGGLTTDVGSLEAGFVVTDMPNATEAIALGVLLSAQDSGTSQETAVVSQTVTQEGAGSDTSALAASFAVADPGIGLDVSVEQHAVIVVSDSGLAADAVVALPTVVIETTDTLVAAEIASLEVALTASDSGLGIDTAFIFAQDSGTATDSAVLDASLDATDAAVGSDAITLLDRPGVDSGVATEGPATLSAAYLLFDAGIGSVISALGRRGVFDEPGHRALAQEADHRPAEVQGDHRTSAPEGSHSLVAIEFAHSGAGPELR